MKKKAFALLGAVGTVLSPMTVLAEDYVYWEDIPSGEENQYINAGEETIIDAYKDLKEDEANALKVSLESTYTKVILKSYDVKTGETTKSLEMKFDSYEKASEYIKDLEDKGIVVENISFVNDTEDEEGSLEKTYSTLEEAASALEEFKNEFSENLESEIIENKTDEVIESTESSESYKTYEEAENALNDFLSDDDNETDAFYFTGEVLGPKGTGEYTKSDINESFNSKEEALSYLEELKENGYTVLDYEFTFDTKVVDGSIDKVFDTKEDAEEALDEFKNEFNNVTSNIEKVHDESEDIKDNFEQSFDDEQAAKDYLDTQLSKNSADVIVEGNISKNESNLPSDKINETYNSLEEAEEALDKYMSLYDVVESYDIEEIEAGTVYKARVITRDEKLYSVGIPSFVIIKKGNEFFVWTMNQLSDKEIAKFRETYALADIDNVVTGDRIASDKTLFIYGLNAFDTSNGKSFTFEERDGQLYIVMDSGAESRVIVGEYVTVSEYKLSLEAYNKSYSYDVAGTITTKGYDYKLTAKGDKVVTLESGKLTGNKEIENQGYYYKLDKKAKTYTVKAKGSKTITKDSGTLSIDTKEDVIETLYSIDLVKQKYTFLGGMGGDEPEDPTNNNGIDDNSGDKDIVNPQTSDESLWVFTAGGFSMIGLAATAYFINKERNN